MSTSIFPIGRDLTTCRKCGEPKSHDMHTDPRGGLDFDATPEELEANTFLGAHPFEDIDQ